GRVLEQDHDLGSRVVSIAGVVESVQYDPRNLVAGASYADGTSVAFEFDALLRLNSKRIEGSSGATLQGWNVERDRFGNVIGVEDLVDSGPDFDQTFTHDAWYRVVSADLGGGSDDAETV